MCLSKKGYSDKQNGLQKGFWLLAVPLWNICPVLFIQSVVRACGHGWMGLVTVGVLHLNESRKASMLCTIYSTLLKLLNLSGNWEKVQTSLTAGSLLHLYILTLYCFNQYAAGNYSISPNWSKNNDYCQDISFVVIPTK